ncbi:MAG: hypothetical protein KF893_20670 [Caldilineaceae bacterium]|nr:hypothetical protein [Caldilineaceae bacterium]
MRPTAPPERSPQRSLAFLLYTVGMIALLALGAVAIWGDLEASLFDVSIRPERSLRSLRCPVLITRQETGQISASFENTGQRPVNRAIRAHISEGFVTLYREENVQLPLQPGERQRWIWNVTAADAAYGYLILARVSALRQAPMPSEGAACGIFVINFPWVKGSLLVTIWLLGGLAAVVGGGWLWWRQGLLATPWRGSTLTLIAMTVVVMAILIVGLSGLWVVGVLLLALFVLLFISALVQHTLGS